MNDFICEVPMAPPMCRVGTVHVLALSLLVMHHCALQVECGCFKVLCVCVNKHLPFHYKWVPTNVCMLSFRPGPGRRQF